MTAYEGWAMVEQMGFRKTVGKVAEVETYGTKMLRLDVPAFAADGTVTDFVTRFCGGPSLYQVTPLDEELALDWAKRQTDPRPVKPTAYQLEQKPSGETHDNYAGDGTPPTPPPPPATRRCTSPRRRPGTDDEDDRPF